MVAYGSHAGKSDDFNLACPSCLARTRWDEGPVPVLYSSMLLLFHLSFHFFVVTCEFVLPDFAKL